uniref:Uncharacterized protein n=1 Tax=Arundo donax TaxID=35708 RepID=A0A0A9FXH9_ARUDO
MKSVKVPWCLQISLPAGTTVRREIQLGRSRSLLCRHDGIMG